MLTYVSETWTLTEGDRKQLNIFERKVYKRILGPVYDNEKENWRMLTSKEIHASVKPTIIETISFISQMKHRLDATLCRFYFCRVTLHVLGASAHHQEYLKLVQRPLVHVLSLQVSHHISLLGPAGPNKEM